MHRGVESLVLKIRRLAPAVLIGIGLFIGASITAHYYYRGRAPAAEATTTLGLSSQELAAVRRLAHLRPEDEPAYHGTQLSTIQVKGLERRLQQLEKAVPLGDSLSAAANDDLRLVQRDLRDLQDRQVLQGEILKEQRSDLSDEIKMWVGIMVTVNVAILGFFWQIARDKNADRTRSSIITTER